MLFQDAIAAKLSNYIPHSALQNVVHKRYMVISEYK